MTENRQFHKFIIITIIVPSAHDSVIRRENALGTLSAAALAVSAAIDCEYVDPRGRELRNAFGPEENKTLGRQDDLINRYRADLTNRSG